ncbi:MAG: 8-oxo-dGTP diphosphatase [Lachnospiraceae bacterium]|nr:8-oxo-dGTP diphosphatase [Lachnospiraceae bacterium]
MILSKLCYLQRDEQMLMLLRNKKQVDVNAGKWIGVGGKFLPGESPEECVVRETFEETGLTLDAMTLRGLLTFASEGWEDECIFVFVSNAFHGEQKVCDEGELRWIPKDQILDLNLWEGDRIFLKLLLEDDAFFSLKLSYIGDALVEQKLHVYPKKA